MLAVVDPGAGGARPSCEALCRRGLLAEDANGDTIRIAPPLVITRDQVEWALDQSRAVLAEA